MPETVIELIHSSLGDWVEIWVNGRMITSGHSIGAYELEMLLDDLGYKVIQYEEAYDEYGGKIEGVPLRKLD